MIAVEIDNKPVQDWIVPPSLNKLDGHHIYWLVIDSIMYAFQVGSHPPPSDIVPLLLSAQGELTISVRQIEEIPCLFDFIKTLAAAHKARSSAKR